MPPQITREFKSKRPLQLSVKLRVTTNVHLKILELCVKYAGKIRVPRSLKTEPSTLCNVMLELSKLELGKVDCKARYSF